MDDINFATNKTELAAEDKADLDKVAEFMKDKPKSYAVIAGYTDNVGSRDHNEGLSRGRAEMVARYLKEAWHRRLADGAVLVRAQQPDRGQRLALRTRRRIGASSSPWDLENNPSSTKRFEKPRLVRGFFLRWCVVDGKQWRLAIIRPWIYSRTSRQPDFSYPLAASLTVLA